jgi:hypothetical protein
MKTKDDEKKKPDTDNDADFWYLLNLFDFLSWP